MMEKELTYIKEMYTEGTGGGCMVDFIVLKFGKVLAISDEMVAVYNSEEDFWKEKNEEGFIWFKKEGDKK